MPDPIPGRGPGKNYLSRRDFLKATTGIIGGIAAIALSPNLEGPLPSSLLPTPNEVLAWVEEKKGQASKLQLPDVNLSFGSSFALGAMVWPLAIRKYGLINGTKVAAATAGVGLLTSCAPPIESKVNPAIAKPTPTQIVEATHQAVATATVMRPTETPIPAPDQLDRPKSNYQASIIKGLALGQIKVIVQGKDGKPTQDITYTGFVNGYPTGINTLYKPDAPGQPFAFGIDQEYLKAYFGATKDSTTGITSGKNRSGATVILNNGVWEEQQTGKVLIPFNLAADGYPVIDVNGKIQQVTQDNLGIVTKLGSPHEMFQAPQDIAKNLTKTGQFKAQIDQIAGVDLTNKGTLAFISQVPTPTKEKPDNTVKIVNETSYILPAEDLTKNEQAKAAMDLFVHALVGAGITVTAQELLKKGFTVKRVEGFDPIDPTKQKKINYDIATIAVDDKDMGGDYPLMLKSEGGEWQQADARKMADITGKDIGTQVVNYRLDYFDYRKSIEMLSNRVLIDGELDADIIFKNFNKEDWQTIIENWDSISQTLNRGELPEKDGGGKYDFSSKYYWNESDKVVNFAQENKSSISAQWLVNNIPQEVLLLPKDNRNKILEFVTKTRVIKYKDQINRWGVANEVFAHQKWGRNSVKGKIYEAIGWEEGIAQMAKWVVQANSKAEPMMGEEYVLETNYENSTTNGYYNLISKLIKTYNAPIKVAGFENHLWVYAPNLPNVDSIKQIIKKFEALGVAVSINELTINTSKFDAITDGYRNPKNITADPKVIQQQMYKELFQAFNDDNIVFFGTSDNLDVSFYRQLKAPDAKAHLFDELYKPKSDYFILLQQLLLDAQNSL